MATTVESLRKAVGKKKNSRAFAWLADLMRQNGDLDAALSYVQAGLSATPSEEGNLVLSKILVEKQDWDGVIEACESVLCRNPYCLSALRRLGDAYAEKGDEEKRNRYYRLLHDLDPLDAFWKEEYAPKIEMVEEMPTLEDSREEASPVAAEASAETHEQEAPVEDAVEKAEEKTDEEKDEDPFSSLATLLPADEESESEVSFQDLENSLDNAIADFSPANSEKDEFPTDEIDGNDISTALSGIFGSVETDEPMPEQGEKANEPSPEEKTEDKPQSLSDAFDSLFGEDELPDEFVLSKPSDDVPSPSVPSEESVQPSAAEETPSAVESPVETSEPLFTKSAEEKSPSEGSLEKSVESSFDSLFGDESDDLPLESLGESRKPESEAPSPSVPSEESVQPSAAEETPSAVESPVETSEPLFTKSAEEKSPSEGSLEKSVESSFDSLFGEGSDDALVDDPTTSTRTLAEIYFEQGVYDEAIKIYKDLLRKNPEDNALKDRLSEIEKTRDDRQKEN